MKPWLTSFCGSDPSIPASKEESRVVSQLLTIPSQ